MKLNQTTRTQEIRKHCKRKSESFEQSIERILVNQANPATKKIPSIDPYLPSLDELRKNPKTAYYENKLKKKIRYFQGKPLFRKLTPFQKQFLARVRLLEWERTGTVQSFDGLFMSLDD